MANISGVRKIAAGIFTQAGVVMSLTKTSEPSGFHPENVALSVVDS